MEEYSKVFQNTITSANILRNSDSDLFSTLALLTQQVEYQRRHSKNLESQLSSLLDHKEESTLTSRNLTLKETNDKLKLENERLKSEKTDLSIELVAEAEERRNAFEAEKRLIATQHQNELKSIQNELEKAKHSLQVKEESFYNEIQLIQASSALSLDEVQSNLNQQVNETSKKLSETLKTSNNLRTELRLLQEEYSVYKNATNLKILELKRKCEYAEEKLKIANSNNINDNATSSNTSFVNKSRSSCSKFTYENRETSVKKKHNWCASKYRPLDTTTTISRSSSEEFIPASSPTRYDTVNRDFRSDRGKNSGTNPKFPRNPSENTKRRKLYSPDDASYFMETLDDN